MTFAFSMSISFAIKLEHLLFEKLLKLNYLKLSVHAIPHSSVLPKTLWKKKNQILYFSKELNFVTVRSVKKTDLYYHGITYSATLAD